MRVYELWNPEQNLYIDRENGEPLIVIPECGDIVCLGMWALPASATEFNSENGIRYTVLADVADKLADVDMSKQTRDEVKAALESLGLNE